MINSFVSKRDNSGVLKSQYFSNRNFVRKLKFFNLFAKRPLIIMILMMKNESFENKSDFQIVRKTFSQLIVIFYNTQKKRTFNYGS